MIVSVLVSYHIIGKVGNRELWESGLMGCGVIPELEDGPLNPPNDSWLNFWT